MDDDTPRAHVVDDTVRLEVHLAVPDDADAQKLGRNMASQGHASKVGAHPFELCEHVSGAAESIVVANIGDDLDDIVLRLRREDYLIGLHAEAPSSDLRRFASTFFAVRTRPAATEAELWARILSSARLSCTCS